MWDMIQSQPEAVRATRDSLRRAVGNLPVPAADARILLTGIGTSFHAALGAAALLRAARPEGAQPIAVPSPQLWSAEAGLSRIAYAIVFSESGETWATLRAQGILRDRRIPQILVSPNPDSSGSLLAEHRLVTTGARESSWTHTVSFTAALTGAAVLASHWGSGRLDHGLELLPAAVQEALGLSDEVQQLVRSTRRKTVFWLLGSGAEEVTVREAALKIREAAGQVAIPVGIEEFLHGTLPAVDRRAGVIAVAATPHELARAREALEAARIAGAAPVLLAIGAERRRGRELPIGGVNGALGIVPHVVPLQLFAYYRAVAEGRNPDIMGLDRPNHLAARRSFGI
jgi:glutamine---fructose-6-phosphate transaminase (isomerizing)